MSTGSTTAGQIQERDRAGFGIYMAFVPWVLFTLITQHDSLKAAAITALGAAVVIALPALIAGRPKLLEIGAIVAFAGFSDRRFLGRCATARVGWRATRGRSSAGVLALIAFGSLLLTPFTEQYARESVPR